MRILLSGANGFIGRYLLAHLLAAGHDVVPAVRDTAQADHLLPKPSSIRVDFNRDVAPGDWVPRLASVDAVINCAGTLQGGRGQSIAAIHTEAPKALFEACRVAGVRRVIQISAISTGANTDYARTKRAADEFLAASALDWVILRPSLVYAGGAYGGTALFRALAALPFAIPVIGKGEQLFQPIHESDLAAIVLKILATPDLHHQTIDPVGPDKIALKDILTDLRRWLGFAPAPLLHVPMPLIAIAARIGDIVGGTMNSTALAQLEFGNTGDVDAVERATGIRPRRWRDMLLANPAQLQDRWQARLHLLRPILRWSIAATWLLSSVAGLVDRAELAGRFAAFGIALSAPMIWATCGLDMLVGLAVLARWRTQSMAWLQLAIVVGYTVALSVAEPSLWLAPFGPLVKNLPFAAAVLVLAALERER